MPALLSERASSIRMALARFGNWKLHGRAQINDTTDCVRVENDEARCKNPPFFPIDVDIAG